MSLSLTALKITVAPCPAELHSSRYAVPAFDGPPELLKTFADLGGPEAWAAGVGNAHKTSTHGGAPLKAQAIEQAAKALLALGISTCQDLRETRTEGLRQAKRAWRGVPGQNSGTSWRYLLMLSDRPGIKPDRMIIRFVAAALGRTEHQVRTDLAANLSPRQPKGSESPLPNSITRSGVGSRAATAQPDNGRTSR